MGEKTQQKQWKPKKPSRKGKAENETFQTT